MTDADRNRLLFGPYATPVFNYGDDGWCELRGEVILCGLTAGRIPRPHALRPAAPARPAIRYPNPTLSAVYSWRRVPGMPDGRRRRAGP
jgi:hypothetical protein